MHEPTLSIEEQAQYRDLQFVWRWRCPGNLRIEHDPQEREYDGKRRLFWVRFDCTVCECKDVLLVYYRIDDAMIKAADVRRRLDGGEE